MVWEVDQQKEAEACVFDSEGDRAEAVDQFEPERQLALNETHPAQAFG